MRRLVVRIHSEEPSSVKDIQRAVPTGLFTLGRVAQLVRAAPS